ncbi:sugar O-acetyltransferase [Imhoffiella purpurea]|uniref:Maltose O-acetyltransferase n=1 Tax=Imhoffiella purpurea TaxID=1249627 RepID=W9UWV3_9GAMM|nr:sugar O-acetyltransferase [Imhoffiella purpurea]EXJ11559.1 Maltose O-acetyltransferase [Imhoffiella purpurea]
MKSEKEKMLAGELYDASDPQLVAERAAAQKICSNLNCQTLESDQKRSLINELFGVDTDISLTPPFYCDYGRNIRLGRRVYFNFNCVVLDVAEVSIGDNVLVGPGVQILTASHPLDSTLRRQGQEFGIPVVIENDVWIGAGAIICPGVTIGAKSVIGAGSVVTKNIGSGVLAVGNPCKVIRDIA